MVAVRDWLSPVWNCHLFLDHINRWQVQDWGGMEETEPCQFSKTWGSSQCTLGFILCVWCHRLRQGRVKGSLSWTGILGSNYRFVPLWLFQTHNPSLCIVTFAWCWLSFQSGNFWLKVSSVFCDLQSPLLGTADQGACVFPGIGLCGSSLQERSSLGFCWMPHCLLFPVWNSL